MLLIVFGWICIIFSIDTDVFFLIGFGYRANGCYGITLPDVDEFDALGSATCHANLFGIHTDGDT